VLINYGVQIIVVTIIFGAIFKELPDVDLRWRDVWVGGLVTAVLFLAGQYLISLYLSKASPASTYGAAGSLVVLLLWVYYSAQILFLGAEFTKAYSEARGSEIVPSENARPLSPEERIHQGIARPGDEERVKPAPAATPAPIPVSGDEEAQAEEKNVQPEVKNEQPPSREDAAGEREENQ
jgi:membrane protein